MYFIIFYNDTFSKIYFSVEVLSVCLPYVEKVFSTTSMKIFFLEASKYSDSFVFAKSDLREEGSQYQSKTFPKTFFTLGVLSMYLAYVRKIFSTTTEKFFSL